MEKFTKRKIDTIKYFMKGRKYEEVNVALGGRDFSYFILPQSLEPGLRDFAYRATGELSDGYVLGVSDSIDVRFRSYVASHEFIEFVEIGMDAPDRCVRALEEELKLVPSDMKPEYIILRRTFFRNLIPYCLARPGSYTEQDIEEFGKSLDRLESLLK